MRLRLRLIVAVAVAGTVAAHAPAARADDPPTFQLTLSGNRFEPQTLTVPPGLKLVLKVRTADATPAEFESTSLGVEKVISAGREATVRLGPLKPGRYPFVDEFHQDTAQGVLVVAGD